MDRTVLYTLLVVFYIEAVLGHSKWRKSCPSSYEEWTRVFAEAGTEPLVYPASKLSMTFINSQDMEDGYHPLSKYEVELIVQTDQNDSPTDFLISAKGEEGCGSGLFVAKDPELSVHQMYCVHRMENVSSQHVTLLWKAPECGCVKLMLGAQVDGQVVIGDDYYFSGQQSHKMCPNADADSEKELDAEDTVDNILDPGFYGLQELEEEKETEDVIVKKEVQSMKKVYKTKHAHHRKKGPPHGHHQKGTHDDVDCKGAVCRKIYRIAAHHQKRYNRLKKWPKKLCLLAESTLPLKPHALNMLDEQRKSWVDAWKKWKFNIGRCCGQDNSTEIQKCLTTLGPLPVPWTRKLIANKTDVNNNVTSEEKLTKLCKKVSVLEWQLEAKPKHVQKDTDKANWEKIWHQRRQDILDCCELSSHDDRMDCVADIRMEKINDICSGQLTPFPGGMAENRKTVRRNRRLSKKCCTLADDERYECFDEVYGWSSSASHGVQQKRKAKRNKPDEQATRFRHQCCKHGRESGIEIQQRRWAKCNHKAGAYLTSKKDIVGHKKGVCKRVFRQCCVRQSHRTIVEDPSASTTPSVEIPTAKT